MPIYTKFSKTIKPTIKKPVKGELWVLYRDSYLVSYKNNIVDFNNGSRYTNMMDVNKQAMTIESYVNNVCEFYIKIENGYLIFKADVMSRMIF